MGKFKTKPYKHQITCLNKYGRMEAFALLADMGTGKTWIIINNAADLWSSGDLDSLLVFAPNGVHTNWTLIELPKHMPDWVVWRSAAWTADQKADDVKAIENVMSGDKGLRIFTMNWEALQNPRGLQAALRFCRSSGKLMIACDESDNFKNPKTKRAENLLYKLKQYSNWRRIMTGTPVNNAPFDLFTQFSFLDEEILGTSSYYAFKAEYAEMLQPGNPLLEYIKKQRKGKARGTPQIVAKGPGGKPKYRNLDKLSKLIAPYSFRVLKSECLDLPDKIYKTLIFRMTKEQIAVYLKAEKECRLIFENNETAFSKLVAIGKLSQITSGYYLIPDQEEPVRIEGANPKLEMLIERAKHIVEEGNQLIIWAKYRVEIADICTALTEEGISFVQYHGGVKKKDRPKAIDDFESGKAKVFVGNPQSGGTGLTLIAASYVIYFSNDYSYRKRSQSEDRAHRIGQTKNVTYINIVAKGTVDEKIVKILSNKEEVADQIINIGLKLFT